MQFRMLRDSVSFILNLFMTVREHDLKTDDDIIYLNLKYFCIIEEIVEKAGGIHRGKKINFRLVVKML